MRKGMGILLFLLVAAACSLVAQVPPVVPMTQKELVDLLKGKVAPERVAALVTERGVDFELTPDIEKKLRKAKADDQLIEAVRQAGPAARAARLAQGGGAGGARVTPEEGQVFLTVQNELDPDRKLQMVKDFETKYPSSALLTDMYAMAALAGLDKNDAQLAVDYAEKSLKLNGDNLRSLLIMAYMLPQPQLLRGGDFDKDKKLSDAETYAKHALELVERLNKLPNETDEQLKERKAQLAMQAHSDLGMIHLQRSAMSLGGPDREELAKAQQEYEMAVSLTTTPTPQDYFRLGETLAIQNKVDEAIQAFTKASELSQGTVLKTYADQRIEALEKRKAQAPPTTRAETRQATPTSAEAKSQAEAKKTGRPLSEKEILDLLTSGVLPARVEEIVRERGISFEVTPGAERELRQGGADDTLVNALKELSASGRP